jgi:hypothetical protein
MNQETPKRPLDREERRRTMMAFIGICADRDDIGDSVEYVRELRKDDRLERLEELRNS